MEWKDFPHTLRSDLNHLYDPSHLRQSALIEMMGLSGKVDAAFRLQKILVDAIGALKSDQKPERPVSQSAYEILHSRYVLQAPQDDLAERLCLSVRQLRREQMVAIEFLAAQLWKQYGRSDQAGQAESHPAPESGAGEWEGDINWLESIPGEAVCDPNLVLVEALDFLQPLLDHYGVELEPDIEGPLPLLSVHQVAFQQALLSVLNVAVRANQKKKIVMHAWHNDAVEIQISWEPIRSSINQGQSGRPPLALVNRLLNIFAGRAELDEDGGIFHCRLLLPVFNRTLVIVIDDNIDYFQLLQRYAAGSRFEIQGIRHLDEVFNEVVQRTPGVILLDIMMPGIDGWDLLRRFRTTPSTQNIPVIISTILPQHELALASGASDFIQKPITQEALLAALDRQAAHAKLTGR